MNRAGNALRALGAGVETRVLMCMLDGIDFPAVFWGAIKAGCVPIPINTLLTTGDLRIPAARLAGAHRGRERGAARRFAPALANQPHIERVVVAGGETSGREREAAAGSEASRSRAGNGGGSETPGREREARRDVKCPGTNGSRICLAAASAQLEAAPTTCDDIAFWLYTLGLHRTPKGSMHLHRDLIATAEHYGVATLGIREDDLVYSAAKLFFATASATA